MITRCCGLPLSVVVNGDGLAAGFLKELEVNVLAITGLPERSDKIWCGLP